MTNLKLKTGIWYGEREIELSFPEAWDVITYWPNTPDALSDEQIAAQLDSPHGCASLERQVENKKRITLVVDDLSRPTPAYRVLPIILRAIESVQSRPEIISIVVATGTHGSQDERALRTKLGDDAWRKCEIEVHNDFKRVKRIGKTSYGTPVYVNRTVLCSDLLIGVGGVYPQHTTGFGGGGKLAIGVCGRQTIMELHYKHKSMEGMYDTNNDFRKDVCEIAEMIGLTSIVTLHIDAFSNVVNAIFGNHADYYDDAAHFSKHYYTAPIATDADLVVANAYPLDTSFTFMRKGYKPLYTAPKQAVRVMIAAAHEGVGVHGLFQHINPSKVTRLRNLLVRAMSMDKKQLLKKIMNRGIGLTRKTEDKGSGKEKTTVLPPNTDHLYVWRTDAGGQHIPPVPNLTVMTEWEQLLGTIKDRHFSDVERVKVCVYPCAPIQCLDDDQ